MVAIDEHGRPARVPGHVAASETDRRREREAQLRRANRLAEREQIRGHRERVGGEA